MAYEVRTLRRATSIVGHEQALADRREHMADSMRLLAERPACFVA